MMARPLFRRLNRRAIVLPLAILGLAPACFRGADTGKIVCGDDDHCPSGYRCRVDLNSQQGRCESASSFAGDDAKAADDAVDAPLAPDGPTGAGGAAALDGTGLGGVSGQGGTPAAGGEPGTGGGGATDAGLGAGGILGTGGMPGLGGTTGMGGTGAQTTTGSGGVVAAGGAAGQSTEIGSGGQGLAGAGGGSSGCPVSGQTPCGTACTDLNTDNSNCGRCGNSCGKTQRCSGGSCVCDKTSCPDGCCSGTTCIDKVQQNNFNCGLSGALCGACSGDSYCSAGTCYCAFSDRTDCGGGEICINLDMDKNHCGSCTKTCKDGCWYGQCYTHLASFAGEKWVSLAVDATYVYLTMPKANTVSRVPKSGGTVEVIAPSQARPGAIAVDGKNIYWLNGGLSTGFGSIMKLPLAGGTATELASRVNPWAIAADGSNVYWSDYGDEGTEAIMKVPIAGGTPVPLASGDSVRSPGAIAIDSTDVYWMNAGSGASGDASIMKVLQAGGTPFTVASGLEPGGGLVLSGGVVYFTSWSGLQSVSASGGKVSTLGVGRSGASFIAADATGLYLGGNGGDLVKFDLKNGGTTRLASGAGGIALDDSNVYWATETDLNVTAKP